MKVLMVCLGNICRSPLAEGILKDKAQKAGLNWQVESRGTGGWHAGNLPDHRSIEIAKERGLDITDQRSQKLTTKDLADFDLIFAMDKANYRDIIAKSDNPALEQKVFLILNEANPESDRSVPDPYYGGENGFSEVYDMIDKACEALVQKHLQK